MRPPIRYPFNGLSPSTLDTFAAVIRHRYRRDLRCAIASIRNGEPTRANFFLGGALATVGTLYDLNDPGAYTALSHAQKVERALKVRGEFWAAHDPQWPVID